jgi:hypothetical protein
VKKPKTAKRPARAPKPKVKIDGDPHRRLHLDKKAEILATDSDSKDPDDLLTTEQLADWLGTSTQFVENGRAQSYGPPYVRLSPRCIRYRRADVVAWLRSRMCQSTAEYQRGPVPAEG